MVVYKTTNLINNKFNIGKDARNSSNYFGSDTLLRRAIKKYGKGNFRKEILETCEDLIDLENRELEWINRYFDDPKCYNLARHAKGGAWTRLHDDEYTKNVYKKRDMTNINCDGANRWFQSLTEDEKRELHTRQGKPRQKNNEMHVKRLEDKNWTYVDDNWKWCEDNGIHKHAPGRFMHPSTRLSQKAHKGWLFRLIDQEEFEYMDKRKIGRENIACKGKTWKLINGQRVWSSKEKN